MADLVVFECGRPADPGLRIVAHDRIASTLQRGCDYSQLVGAASPA